MSLLIVNTWFMLDINHCAAAPFSIGRQQCPPEKLEYKPAEPLGASSTEKARLSRSREDISREASSKAASESTSSESTSIVVTQKMVQAKMARQAKPASLHDHSLPYSQQRGLEIYRQNNDNLPYFMQGEFVGRVDAEA